MGRKYISLNLAQVQDGSLSRMFTHTFSYPSNKVTFNLCNQTSGRIVMCPRKINQSSLRNSLNSETEIPSSSRGMQIN